MSHARRIIKNVQINASLVIHGHFGLNVRRDRRKQKNELLLQTASEHVTDGCTLSDLRAAESTRQILFPG